MISPSAITTFSWHALDHICRPVSCLQYKTGGNWSKFSRKPPGWSGAGTLTPCREAGWGGLVQPGEDMGWGGPDSSFPVSWGGYREDGAKLFTARYGRRMRGDGRKLKREEYRLNISKIVFPMRTVNPLNRLPGKAVRSPFLEDFKTCRDKALSNLVWHHSWPCLSRRSG